jgi:hypothetical protein
METLDLAPHDLRLARELRHVVVGLRAVLRDELVLVRREEGADLRGDPLVAEIAPPKRKSLPRRRPARFIDDLARGDPHRERIIQVKTGQVGAADRDGRDGAAALRIPGVAVWRDLD